MPSSVEEVKFRMDRVLLGTRQESSLESKSSAFVVSGDGEGGKEDSDEAGVSSKPRRGVGRIIFAGSDMVAYSLKNLG